MRLDRDGRVGVERGAPVVCIPVYGRHELFARCLRSVLEHTPPEVPILVADDATPGAEIPRAIDALAPRDRVVHYLRQERNVGFVENANAAFRAVAPGDPVLVNSDCEVGPEWVERLRAAAYCVSNVASATALTNHGTILSVPRRNEPSGLGDVDVDATARAVADGSRRLRPRIPTMIGHCVYVRRSALDLVGDFDTAFSPGYGEEVDLSQRCVLAGLVHVAADDVFVAHHGGATFGVSPLQAEHEQVIAERYPYYHGAVDAAARSTVGPLARSLAVAARAFEPLGVTIDARCLVEQVTGTQVHVLELVRALARSGRVRLRVLVAAGIGDAFRRALEELPGVELIPVADVGEATPRTAIVHRPYQVFDRRELDLLARLGDRFVVTHQDLISYRNPGYSRSLLEWEDLTRLTRMTLALADRVLFFSRTAADDALADELVDERRIGVAHLGVDHGGDAAVPRRPAALPEAADDGFLLCLGTSYRHKNRVFALRVLEALRRRHAWDGRLVLAGGHATIGGSEAEEAEYLAAHEEIASRAVDLGAVPEAEKDWLIRNARGVLYPSLYEGFGLIPFEAAQAGVSCFFAWQTALRELLPREAARIVEWDADATADSIFAVLCGEEDEGEIVRLVREAGAELTWDRTAGLVLDAYEQALLEPRAPAAVLAADVGSPAALASRASARSVDQLALPDDAYRAFLALTTRPRARRLLFGALTFAHRAGYVVRRRRLPPSDDDPFSSGR